MGLTPSLRSEIVRCGVPRLGPDRSVQTKGAEFGEAPGRVI